MPNGQNGQNGFLFYRVSTVAFALLLIPYFYYRFVHSVEGTYQVAVVVLELYGALNVLLLGVVRFRCPWAPATPSVPSAGSMLIGDDEAIDDVAVVGGGSGVGSSGGGDGSGGGPFDVAILVPCYSEPDDVLFNTIRAALALDHPLAARVRVCLCDDGGLSHRRAALARLAPPERALYVSRPKDPKVPNHGKAGNLNYCLREVLYPDGPPGTNAVVVVFDCDMEAHADFLAHTLPYLDCERETALVQTPQHFYNVAPAGDVFNHHNLFFYQAMQPGLDAWGATFCCGTNFVARAAALHEVGWFPTESITEDFLLGEPWVATLGQF